MPIKPENAHHYRGPGWKEIRARILERAGNRCEKCGVPNHGLVARYGYRPGWAYGFEDGKEYSPSGPTGERVRASEMPTPDRIIKIVLTVAHLDNDPSNMADENLLALCQWHHLCLDKEFHQANARKTRTKRKDAARPLFS